MPGVGDESALHGPLTTGTRRVLLASLVGTTVEFYDFYIA